MTVWHVCKSKRVKNMQSYTSKKFWSLGMFINWGKNVFSQPLLCKKNPAYGRHELSRPMRIVGPIQFWRGCVIYRSAPKADLVHAKMRTPSTLKWGLGPRKNADSVHSGTHPRFKGSTRDWDRNQTPEHILVFRALLEIKIELRNTFSFLGLYSRSRSNSGTHPRF